MNNGEGPKSFRQEGTKPVEEELENMSEAEIADRITNPSTQNPDEEFMLKGVKRIEDPDLLVSIGNAYTPSKEVKKKAADKLSNLDGLESDEVRMIVADFGEEENATEAIEGLEKEDYLASILLSDTAPDKAKQKASEKLSDIINELSEINLTPIALFGREDDALDAVGRMKNEKSLQIVERFTEHESVKKRAQEKLQESNKS